MIIKLTHQLVHIIVPDLVRKVYCVLFCAYFTVEDKELQSACSENRFVHSITNVL